MKCSGKSRQGNDCRNNSLLDKQYCKNHIYMETYEPYMLQQLVPCSSCKHMVYLENSKICEACKIRGKQQRDTARELVILCAKKDCKFKKSSLNAYCNKHQIHHFLDTVRENNKKPCTQYIRGCRNVLNNDNEYKKCEECREKERTSDKTKREKVREKNEQSTQIEQKCCTTCGKEQVIENFIGLRNKITSTCQHCRNQNKIQDVKRDKEHRRAQGRIYDSKESRRNNKDAWKKANWSKVVEIWRNYRKKQIENNEEKYLEENAQFAKQWRLNNVEKCKENNENKKNNIACQYKVYIQSAAHRKIQMCLSFEEYQNIARNPCYYCGKVNEIRQFHGIDRMDNTNNYTIENCVPCCSICNYMKGELHHDIFIKHVEHVLTNLKIIEGKLYEGIIQDYSGCSYNAYKKRAVARKITFEISEEEFNSIVSNECYMCGKSNTITHNNGIDRYNNKEGYIINNCKPCCGGCNYIKSYFSYDTVINYFRCIYNNCISYS